MRRVHRCIQLQLQSTAGRNNMIFEIIFNNHIHIQQRNLCLIYVHTYIIETTGWYLRPYFFLLEFLTYLMQSLKLKNHVFMVADFARKTSSLHVIYFTLNFNFFSYPIFIIGKRIWTLNIQSIFICLPAMAGWVMISSHKNQIKHWRKCREIITLD